MNFVPQSNQLTDQEVAIGLLDRGLFTDKLPPCFTSLGLCDAVELEIETVFSILSISEKKFSKELKKRSHNFLRYNSLRDTNVPRHMGIPHPESYSLQVFAIKKYWLEIQSHCQAPLYQVSRIFVRRCKNGLIFKMSYKGPERWKLEEIDLEHIAGKGFVVDADISSCYPSIYTHSIPWALNGKNIAKKNREDLADMGNLLDRVTQGLRDGQTNGLLIGPVSSSIISEIILTRVDAELCNKGYNGIRRNIDDYEYFARDNHDAQNFLHELGMSLREFELTINDKKTNISKLPKPMDDAWIRRIRRIRLPKKNSLCYSSIKVLLDWSVEISAKIKKSSPIYYAFKIIGDKRLNERAKKMTVQHCMNLSMSIPYLVPAIDEYIFEKHTFVGIKDKIESYAKSLLDIGMQRLYTDTIAYSIYFACRYQFSLHLTSEEIGTLLQINDCICLVLLHEYAIQHNNQNLIKTLKSHADTLKIMERRDMDRYWLFVYQLFSEQELIDSDQSFLAVLKSKSFQFVHFHPLPSSSKTASDAISETSEDEAIYF